MKKLMFMLAAVACAAAVQAASVVNWNSGTIYAPGADGTGWGDPVADGTSGYLATLYVWGDYENGELKNPVAFGSGATSSTLDGGMLLNTTDDVLDDDKTYYAQLVITYGDSTLTSQIVTMETSSITGTADPYFGDGGMLIDPLPGESLDATYGAFSSSGWTKSGGGVPEPTSALLLLVGGALLGLRRRR